MQREANVSICQQELPQALAKSVTGVSSKNPNQGSAASNSPLEQVLAVKARQVPRAPEDFRA